MPFTTIFRALPLKSWLVVAAVIALAVLVSWCALDARRKAKEAERRAEAGQTLADGRTGAARDASAIRDRADERNDQITQAVKEGTADVRQAPDRAAANAAARRGVCRINPDAHPDCRMLLSDPGELD